MSADWISGTLPPGSVTIGRRWASTGPGTTLRLRVPRFACFALLALLTTSVFSQNAKPSSNSKSLKDILKGAQRKGGATSDAPSDAKPGRNAGTAGSKTQPASPPENDSGDAATFPPSRRPARQQTSRKEKPVLDVLKDNPTGGQDSLCVLDPGMMAASNTFMRRKTLAQTFVPVLSGNLTKITHGLQNISGVNNYDLLITTTTGATPSWTGGSYNVASVLYKATGLTTFASSGIVNAVVTIPPLSLTAGTKYALILIPGTPTTGNMAWRGNSGAGSYAAGSAYELNGGTWSVPTVGPKDHGFKLEGPCDAGPGGPGASKWCCPGTNLLTNGDFESGNMGVNSAPGYVYNPAVAANATAPGQYNIVTGTQAAAISSTWNAADHTTCNTAAGKFLVVNGRTSVAGYKTIWKQTVNTVKGKQYHFCANVRNLPQCAFDIKPRVRVLFNNPTMSLGPVGVSVTNAVCDWQLLSTSFTASAGGPLTIDMQLDESGVGDGNDLAVDDVSLQEMSQVSEDYVAISIATTHPTGGKYHVTASYPPNLPGFPYGYLWQVCELDANDNCIPGNSVSNPPLWWTYTGPVPPGQFNNFPTYNGLNGNLNGPSPGDFIVGKRYRITFAVWSDCEAIRVSSWLLQYVPALQAAKATPLKIRQEDFKMELPSLPLNPNGAKEQDSPMGMLDRDNTPGRSRAPGATEAALLPRAEDNPSLEVALPRPSVHAGQAAPDFAVQDANGKTWRLADLKGRKNVLLTFFPKCFTGGCANHLSSLRDHQAQFDAADTQIIAVSVDRASGEKGQIAFARMWELTFPMVPDTDRRLSRLYGAAENERQLAARMSVYIDKRGIVRFVDTAVNVHTHGADVIARIHGLQGNGWGT